MVSLAGETGQCAAKIPTARCWNMEKPPVWNMQAAYFFLSTSQHLPSSPEDPGSPVTADCSPLPSLRPTQHLPSPHALPTLNLHFACCGICPSRLLTNPQLPLVLCFLSHICLHGHHAKHLMAFAETERGILTKLSLKVRISNQRPLAVLCSRWETSRSHFSSVACPVPLLIYSLFYSWVFYFHKAHSS